MALFTASPDVSSFTPPNQLFNLGAAIQSGQAIQQNQLAQQTGQLQLNQAEGEQVARASAGLLLTYPDEASRAAAYPKVVGMLQSQGFAKNAPPQYPGAQTLQALARMGTPSEVSSTQLANIQANQAYGNATGGAGGAGAQPGVTIPAYGTGGPGASATVPPEYMPYFQEASQKTGIPVDLLIAQARQESGFSQNRPGAAGEIGIFQIKPDTARSPGPGMAGVDPATISGPDNARNNILFGAQYLKTHMGNGDPSDPAVQARALRAYNGLGPGGDPNYVQNVFRYRPAPGTATASAAPPGAVPPGAGAAAPAAQAPGLLPVPPTPPTTPPPYQVASNVPVPPPGAAPTLPPAATDTGQQPQPALATGAAQPPAAPAQPPAATTPVRQPPGAPQAPTPIPLPPPPQPPVTNANGLTDQQQAQINAIAANPSTTLAARVAAEQAYRNQNIQQRQQSFADYMQQQTLVVAQNNSATQKYEADVKAWQAAHPAPTTPRFTQGSEAVWNPATKAFEPVTPDNANLGPPVPGSWGVNNIGQQQFLPASTGAPARGSYDEQAKAYAGDLPIIQQVGEAGRNAQASTLQLNELADVIKNVPTGGLAPEFRTKVAALLEANGAKPETIKAYTGMESGSDAQVLQKLAIATIGASAKSDLGSNVGVNSLNLYAGANPGLDKLPDANKRVTNMIRVARAQVEGYSLGAQQFFNQNQSNILHTAPGQVPDYHPLSEYNAQWQAQNNPQIGAAAIGILNGDPFDKWAARAGPSDATNAVQLAARIDPNVKIPVKGGGFKSAQDVLNHSASQ